jgi:hypothetical protein
MDIRHQTTKSHNFKGRQINRTRGDVVTTCNNVLEIAIRLESACVKFFPLTQPGTEISPDFWIRCAVALLAVNRQDALYPIDPELFVASQFDCGETSIAEDVEIAIARYKSAVTRTICKLRQELTEELKWLNSATRRGLSVERLIRSHSRRITPLSLYMHAQRMNRGDLADGLISQVLEQHEHCPLYRAASSQWLEEGRYPAFASLERWRRTKVVAPASWDVTHN